MKTTKTALILGVGGQDGAYLARHLLSAGYRVVGTSRVATPEHLANLGRLGLSDRVEVVRADLTSLDRMRQVVEAADPDEIYNLAGQTSVGASFGRPLETFESLAAATLYLLEAVRASGRSIRVFSAGSGEVFGGSDGDLATEATPFRPRSPYAAAKASAFWQVVAHREAYGIYACTGVLFNHESPLRPDRFVTRKVVDAARRIAAGSGETLTLGNLDVVRDWGWAEEYVVAMWRMLQQDTPEDFVIATGEPLSLRAFVAEVFAAVDLDWEEHVQTSDALLRPNEPRVLVGDPARARRVLGWSPETCGRAVARRLIHPERSGNAGHRPLPL